MLNIQIKLLIKNQENNNQKINNQNKIYIFLNSLNLSKLKINKSNNMKITKLMHKV